MSKIESNEITVKLKCEIEEIYKILEEKGFKIADRFTMDDTYLIPENLELEEMTTREILSKAVLVREIRREMPKKVIKNITFKRKKFDENGNILSQDMIGCDVLEIEENEECNTIEKLITRINELEIPIYTDNYFVKKAEIELNRRRS